MRLVFSIVGVLILTVLAAPGESSAQSVAGRTARTVVTFDNVGDAPGVPEGITADGKDGLYVSLFVLDQIWHVNPATGEKKKVADVPGGELKGRPYRDRARSHRRQYPCRLQARDEGRPVHGGSS